MAQDADLSLADPLPADPIPLLGEWLGAPIELDVQPNPWAMTVATVDPEGRPEARVVICRGFDATTGHVVFYTNRNSAKGVALAARPRAACVFHWDALARQIRISGPVTVSPDAESDAYFASRPRGAQVSAWASDQSQPVSSREELLRNHDSYAERLGRDELVRPIPRPPHWGGYRVWIEEIELWAGRESRVHDRARWTRELEPTPDGWKGGPWRTERLQP